MAVNLRTTFPTKVDYIAKNASTPETFLAEINSQFVDHPVIPYKCAYHVDRKELYIVDWDNHRVVVCDTDGRHARVFYRIDLPEDVAVSSDGNHIFILHCDPEEPEDCRQGPFAIEKVNLDGTLDHIINITPFGQLLDCPSMACHNGHIAVLSRESQCVVIYKNSGHCLRHFRLSEYMMPSAMTVDKHGNVLVTDSADGAVNVYSWAGEFLEKFGDLEYGCDSPSVCVDADGYVCVARYIRHRVDVYTPERRLLTSLGTEGIDLPNLGRLLEGRLKFSRTLCLLPDGRLTVITDDVDSIQML